MLYKLGGRPFILSSFEYFMEYIASKVSKGLMVGLVLSMYIVLPNFDDPLPSVFLFHRAHLL